MEHKATRRVILAAVLSTFFLPVGAPLLNAQPAEAKIFELRRGVIVHGAKKAMYLGAPNGSVEAIDLSAGRVLWTSADAALPLAVDGELLAAQGETTEPGRLPIAVLDLQAGGRTVVAAVIPLPADVQALIGDQVGRAFRATAQREERGFLISWSYTQTKIEGIAREPEEELESRTVYGAAHVDLATGAVTAQAAAPPRLRVDAAAERLKSSQSLARTPWRAGNVLATTDGGRGGALTLKRWDARTGAPLPDRVLLKKAITALASSDETYLLASERVGAGGADDPEYLWSIFLLETGERVGELRRDVSAAPFFIWNDSVVYESRPYGYRTGEVWIDEPLKIRALRLARGVPVWDRPVRHLEYRGPVPPSR